MKLASLNRFFLVDRMAKNVVVLVTGTVIGQALIFLLTPFLTRTYSPEQFGYLAVYISIVGIISTFSTFRYEVAIALPASDSEAMHIVVLCLILNVLTAVILGLVFWKWGSQYLIKRGIVGFRGGNWLFPMGVVGAGMTQVLTFLALRQNRLTHLAHSRIIQSSGQVGIQVLGASSNSWGFGLPFGDAIARIVTIGVMFWQGFYSKIGQLRFKWKMLFSLAYRYRKFPLLAGGSSLFNTLGFSLPPIMVATMYSTSEAGLFAVSDRLIGLPLALLGQAISQAYLSECASIIREDRSKLKGLFRQTTYRLALVGIPLILLLALVGPRGAELLLGHKWSTAGAYVRVLVPMYIVQVVANPVSATLILLERQGLQLAWDSIRLITVLVVFFLAARFGASPHVAVGLFGLAMAGMYLVLLLILDKAVN